MSHVFVIVPHFDVICDQLLNRVARTRKIFVKLIMTIKLTVTCDNTLFVASVTQLVSSRPRDSSETFLLAKLVGHRAQSPVS